MKLLPFPLKMKKEDPPSESNQLELTSLLNSSTIAGITK